MRLKTIVFIVLIVLVAGGGLYYQQYKSRGVVEAAALAKEAGDASRRLDYKLGIEKFTVAAQKYLEKGKRQDAALQMIKVGFLQNKSGDYKKGIATLKAIAFDETLPDPIHSEAIIRMAVAAFGGGGRVALEEIFQGEGNPIIKEALAGKDPRVLDNMQQGLYNLFKISRQMHDFGYASYAMAIMKSVTLRDDAKKHKPEDVQQRINDIKELIADGDVLTEKEKKMPDFYPSKFIYDFYTSAKNQKLNALTQLARIDRSYEPAAAQQFEESMKDFKHVNNANARGTEGYARFYYASMLADLYGPAKRTEIHEIIAPTMLATGDWRRANETLIWTFYKLHLTRPKADQGPNTGYVLSIADADPEFDAFLKAKGWK